MKHSDLSQATNEELLRRVIEAQMRGGYMAWSDLEECNEAGVLRILIDTDGCKAIYNGWWCEDCNGRCPDEDCPFHAPLFVIATYAIVEAWHSGEGNNVRAALETSVSFLPEV